MAQTLKCLRAGCSHMRHDKFHDSLANLLRDICHYVEIDPHLQPKQVETFYLKSSTTNNDAKLVIKADRV